MPDGSKQKQEEKEKKDQKCQQLCFELGERQPNCMVEPILSMTGDLGGGMKNLKEDIKILLWNKKRL